MYMLFLDIRINIKIKCLNIYYIQYIYIKMDYSLYTTYTIRQNLTFDP